MYQIASPFGESDTAFCALRTPNQAPTIIDLDSKAGGNQTGTVSISSGPEFGNITSVRATDPDVGDSLRYSIVTTGPNLALFTISSNGELIFTRPVWAIYPADCGTYTIIVTVTDDGGMQDTGTITLDVKYQVVWVRSSNNSGIEGSTDQIVIEFHRGYDTSEALTVEFSTTQFSISDFVADAEAAAFFANSVEIPAGSENLTLTLTVAPDGVPEILETGIVALIETGAYALLRNPTNASATQVELIVDDGVKLFIDGVPGAPDGNVIDPNDIEQGAIGNCFVLATLSDLARRRPDLIQAMVAPKLDTPTPLDFTVRFYDLITRIPFYVTVTLDRGNGAHPHDNDGTRTEVWVSVIEQAYNETFTWTEGAPPELAYQHLTNGNGISNVDYLTDDQIRVEIENALAAGKGVIWGTGPWPRTLRISMHAYAVLEIGHDPISNAEAVVLWNPHGYFEYVTINLLRANLGALTILD